MIDTDKNFDRQPRDVVVMDVLFEQGGGGWEGVGEKIRSH